MANMKNKIKNIVEEFEGNDYKILRELWKLQKENEAYHKECLAELDKAKQELGNDNPTVAAIEDMVKAASHNDKLIMSVIVPIERRNYYEGKFDSVLGELFTKDAFLAEVSMAIRKVPDFSCPTAYVGIRYDDDVPEVIIGFNPIFLDRLTKKERVGVFKHELYHVVFQHLFSRTIIDPDKNIQTLANFAMDMAINSIITKENIPEGLIIPGQRPQNYLGKPVETNVAKAIEDAKPLEATEYYFRLLREAFSKDVQEGQEKQCSSGGGGGGGGDGDSDGQDESYGLNEIQIFDEHEWGAGEDIPQEIMDEIRSRMQEAIVRGVSAADRTNSWGDTPHQIREEIRKMVSREIRWESVVKNFIGRVRSLHRTSSMKRINKKAPYIFPGARRKMVARFAVFMDQSGSVSDEDIMVFFGELDNLTREYEIDLYYFDTEVDEENMITWKRNQYPKTLRTRCGGTDFEAVARFLNDSRKTQYDGAFILTDGYAPTMSATRRTKVCWVITEHGDVGSVREGDLVCKLKSEDKGNFKMR